MKITCENCGFVNDPDVQITEWTVAVQEAKLKTYNILKKNKLPIPAELASEIESQRQLGSV